MKVKLFFPKEDIFYENTINQCFKNPSSHQDDILASILADV
jgi:hypothetical protein